MTRPKPVPSMPEVSSQPQAPRDPIDIDDPHTALRQLGARAHELCAAARAADHFNASDSAPDHHIGSWLISGALLLADEVAADLDELARSLRDRPTDASLRHSVSHLRVRAHQFQAAAHAADHFLDQDSREDQETGGWLIASALRLARRLAAEMDNCATPMRRSGSDLGPAHDGGGSRRIAAAAVPVRGTA